MIQFKKLTIEDKDTIEKYTVPYNFVSCEYSFTTLYLWRYGCDIHFAIYKDVLLILKRDFSGNYHFMQPLGYTNENLLEILNLLIEYKLQNNLKYIFKDLDNNFKDKVKSLLSESAFKQLDIKEDRDNFDYIYEGKKLMTLSGKKLHKKKNHYNYFIKNYKYIIKDIKEGSVINDCIFIAEKWFNNSNKDKYLKYELDGIKDILNNYEKLNLKGMAVYIDDKISGFTLGEKMSNDLAIIHVEKANNAVNGLYTFITKTFIENYFNDICYINREQDLGIEGLRKAKESYFPIKMEEKFIVNIS